MCGWRQGDVNRGSGVEEHEWLVGVGCDVFFDKFDRMVGEDRAVFAGVKA